ncbi:MAG: Bor/Iss family lipoprotein [Chitinophagaceae bacterium]
MRKYTIPVYRTFLLIISVAVFERCTVTTRIITSTQCAGAANTVRDTTVRHYFWGLKQAADIKPGCDTRFNHLNKVEVKTKFGQMLIGVITLGIVIPQTVTWCCAPYNPTPGSLGEPR